MSNLDIIVVSSFFAGLGLGGVLGAWWYQETFMRMIKKRVKKDEY